MLPGWGIIFPSIIKGIMESRMTKNIEELKKSYADLLIRSGLNLRKGQRLAISCPVECADFARLSQDSVFD